MNFQEIIEEKNWWYQKDNHYILSYDWIHQYKKPAPYPAFIWWDEYKLITLRLYFRIAMRERIEDRILNAKTDIGKFKYTVIISGAISTVPLPIEIWEQESSDPWHGGFLTTVDPFYFGRKYKMLEEEYRGKQLGFSSTLIKGFDDLEEAKEFMEMWKVKAIDDHKEEIDLDKEIMKLL